MYPIDILVCFFYAYYHFLFQTHLSRSTPFTLNYLEDFTVYTRTLTFEYLTEIREWIGKCRPNESDAKTWLAQFLNYY